MMICARSLNLTFDSTFGSVIDTGKNTDRFSVVFLLCLLCKWIRSFFAEKWPREKLRFNVETK
jgi:hypothetical protein